MTTNPTPLLAINDVPTYQVFALPPYTVFVYDGGARDHRIYPGRQVLLHESTFARSLAPFHGRVMWPIKFQRDWIVFEVRSCEEPKRRLGLAVRYRRLGGWSRYLAWAVRGFLWTFCLLSPNNFSFPVPSQFHVPYSHELQLHQRLASSTVSSLESAWWK
ncbi:hypothetical protein C8Q77DRAFT_1158114 [Trametes polyzona]|nr:hypothetical protein C8Q77DRAFT_1158114 [Trametes polyzona]